MRLECAVDQSWIWKVPNPAGSYRLFDETTITTSIMYYNIGFFKAYAKVTIYIGITNKNTPLLAPIAPKSPE